MSMRTNSLDLNRIRTVSRRGLLRAAALLVVALTVLAASGVWAAPAAVDRYVATTGIDSGDCSNAGSPCLTIQYAIDQAAAGDTVNVAAGTYDESPITINKAVTLEGANVGIAGNGARGAESQILNTKLTITAAGVVLDGFEIYQTDNTADAILIQAAATVQNSIIKRDGVTTGQIVRGITTAVGTAGFSITDNLFTGDTSGGLFGGHKTWNSCMYLNGGSGTIADNEIENCRTGINADDFNAGISITGNTFGNSGTYLAFGGTTPTDGQFTIAGNEFFIDWVTPGLPSAFFNNSNVAATFRLDAIGNTFGGVASASLSDLQKYHIEARNYHRGRSSRNGVVDFVANQQVVMPGTTIASAIAAAAANDSVLIGPGTFNEAVTVNKSLTITGAGDGDNATVDTILDGTSLTGRGMFLPTGVTDVTIENMRIRNYTNASGSGIYANGQNDNFTVQNVAVLNNGTGSISAAGGIFMNGPVDNVLIDNVMAHNNTGRGIVIWNGFKTNITITNNDVQNNNCCGIELQDGTASGVTMTGNTVKNNSDSGMSAIGLMAGAGENLIADNTLENNGRFGIEIKIPNGTGLDSGDGSIVVENNDVSLTAIPGDLRDYAGIAVFRRGFITGQGYVDIPNGVIVRNNTVSGYQQSNGGSVSTGFGIVVEGTAMFVEGNTLEDNDVGIQVQAGHTPYTANAAGDGNQNNVADDYFGRGNSPIACASVAGNTFTGNTIDSRSVGAQAGGLVHNVTANTFHCGIQVAVDAATAGDVIEVSAGTYTENVNVDKSIDLRGANYGIDPNTGTRVAETILNGTFSLRSSDISIDGFSVTGASFGFAAGGTGPWSNITLTNNIADSKTGGQVILNGFGVVATTIGSENWTISNNRITNIQANAATAMALFNIDGLTITDNVIEHTNTSYTGRRGINLDGSLNVTVSGNSIDMGEAYPTATANTPWAIQVSMSDRAVSNVTIEDNTVENTYYGVVGLSQRSLTNLVASNNQFVDVTLGLAFNSGSATPVGAGTLMSDISITDNDIDSSNRSVYFRNLHSAVNGGVAFNSLDVNNNNLVRTTAGVALEADAGLAINDGQVDGTCNWFGSALATAVQARVAGAVTFLPFEIAADGACTGTGPVVNLTQNTSYFAIQTAVDTADPNDVIQAAPGSYVENVTVDLPLTIQGAFDASFARDVAVGSQAPGVWYTDRYAPAVFESYDFGGEMVLRHGVRVADSAANRPPSFSSTFYNTQGRKLDTNLTGAVSSMSIDLWVDASWDGVDRNAGIWATGFDAGNAVSAYPIVAWRGGGTAITDAAGFYAFDYINGGWLLLRTATPEDFDAWHTLTFEYTVGTGVDFKVDGETLLSFADADTTSLGNLILNVYNFGADYDVYWDNFQVKSENAATFESVIVGRTRVQADDVNLYNLYMTNPGQTNALLVDKVGGVPVTNTHIAWNRVQNVGAPALGSNVQGIYLDRGQDNVTIEYNQIGHLSGRSVNGVFVGDSASNDDVDGLLVQNNNFHDVTGTHGAYGVLINIGSITGSGVTNSPQIIGNSFDSLSGLWTHAIGLEGETPGAVVEDNEFSNLTASGIDNAAIFFEKNPDGPSVTLACNKFNATAGAFFGIAIHPNDLPGGSNGFDYEVDGTLNYWGDADGPTSPGIGNGAGVGLNVLFSPWYVDDTCTTTAAVATINIVLDTQPDAAVDVNFTGDLGAFTLDDDADGTLPNTETQLVLADTTHDVVMTVPSGYFLTDVTCDSANGVGDKPNKSAAITPDPDEEITCTFVNARAARVSVIKFEDTNGNGVQNVGEGRLASWDFMAYNGVDANVLASGTTNSSGVTVLEPLEPYAGQAVCEDLPINSPFANTSPGFRDAIYSQPCKSVMLNPGQWLAINFGNTDLTGNDADEDRIGDDVDNCVYIANPFQEDANNNGVGDACESTLTIVQDTVPNLATNFIFNGDLGYFLLDDDSDPALPNQRSFGIETGSGLGLVTTTQTQTQYAHWDLTALSCDQPLLTSVNIGTGQIQVTPTTPGQTITCTYQNSPATRVASVVEPDVTFSVDPLRNGSLELSAVFNWTVSNASDVAGIDLYVAGRIDGAYQPLLVDMPVDASGNAMHQGLPDGTWYYILVVRLTNGEPVMAGPVPLSPTAPTASALVAQQAGSDGHNPTLALVAIGVAMFALGTVWVSSKRRRDLMS